MRFIQVAGFFGNGVLKGAIQSVQFRRHVVEGAGKLAQFVGQRGIRRGGVELPLFDTLARRHQIIQRQHNLTSDAPQGEYRQQQNAQPARQRHENHQLNFMFSVVLKRQHKGIYPANEILNVVLIPPGIAAGDAFVHLLPAKVQLLVTLFDVLGHIPAV